jgi:glycosyltransferase involved in cell wall biosynthesis
MHELVSVVIPSKDRPELLQAAVKSVLSQTYRNFEVVVVLDGPNRVSVDLLLNVTDVRLRVVELDQTVGACQARNEGVRASRGTWIALLDDDDVWLPSKLAEQMEVAAGLSTRYSLVSCFYYMSPTGTPSGKVRPRREPRDGEDLGDYIFDFYCAVQTSTIVARRELLLEVPFRNGLSGLQDTDWLLRLTKIQNFKIVFVRKPLSVYYLPDQRATITAKMDSSALLQWGRERRETMSRLSYSRFLVRKCLKRAIEEGVGVRGVAAIAREAIHDGQIDAKIFAAFWAILLTTQRRSD